jgi:hypothetical protein
MRLRFLSSRSSQSQRGVPRFLLYDWPEFSTLLKNCTDKKEAALERKASEIQGKH